MSIIIKSAGFINTLITNTVTLASRAKCYKMLSTCFCFFFLHENFLLLLSGQSHTAGTVAEGPRPLTLNWKAPIVPQKPRLKGSDAVFNQSAHGQSWHLLHEPHMSHHLPWINLGKKGGGVYLTRTDCRADNYSRSIPLTWEYYILHKQLSEQGTRFKPVVIYCLHN